jgi:hypothetical protein
MRKETYAAIPWPYEKEYRHWKLKDEALNLTLWRHCFGRGYEGVARQTTRKRQSPPDYIALLHYSAFWRHNTQT